ncbi:phosphatase PAP2 family protein [Trinickia terrae]|uniref:phosphatase PAP2 family protein n=1 Tax=Trinickia terrae TaxID=2571161 RepID=UPI001F0DCD83|nr:phosphatase PAP2 family protein [Trinickia terrae]
MDQKTSRLQHRLIRGCAAAFAALAVSVAQAGGGPFGIDHEIGHDESGIWSRNVQVGLEYGVVATELGGAHWQSDVLAGWALSAAVGYLSTTW